MINTYTKEEQINGQTIARTYTNIANLQPDPANPRDIPEDKLTDLMDFLSKWKNLAPLLVDAREEKNGQLLGGNMRLAALKRLGEQEVWVEFRNPGSDAEAFEIATLANQAFGHYVADKLEPLLTQYHQDIDLSKLGVELQEPPSFDELLRQFNQEQPQKPMKYEITIKCLDENDLNDKMGKIAGLGIQAKKRGK